MPHVWLTLSPIRQEDPTGTTLLGLVRFDTTTRLSGVTVIVQMVDCPE